MQVEQAKPSFKFSRLAFRKLTKKCYLNFKISSSIFKSLPNFAAYKTKLLGEYIAPGHQHTLLETITLGTHTHTVNSSTEAGGHVHAMGGTGGHGRHTHAYGKEADWGGGHGSGGNTDTAGAHTHTSPSTNASGNNNVTYSSQAVISDPVTVPAAAVDMFLHTTVVYKFKLIVTLVVTLLQELLHM